MGGTQETGAIIWCSDAFNTGYGKTAHGLVRRSRRYPILAVIDPVWAGRDAGDVLDGSSVGIPVVSTLNEALDQARIGGGRASHLVIGVATDGGRLPAAARASVLAAIDAGLDVDSGMHDFLTEDPEIAAAAVAHGVTLRDVRKTPPRSELHAFSGEIAEVDSLRVAVLGTDSAVGKRTTAWKIVEAAEARGQSAELIGTGQTAWMQGARYSIILDSLINDFVAGELEHAVVRAWRERRPDLLVVEGQGSLMNPAYPGGYEILAATRPHAIVLQHAPARAQYDGFPGFPIQPLPTQIQLIEMLAGRPVVAVTLNHEGIDPADVPARCAEITAQTGLPCLDVLLEGGDRLIDILGTLSTGRRPDPAAPL